MYCGRQHEIKWGKNALHLRRRASCSKKNNFQAVGKLKKENVERVEENETNMEVFSVKNKNKNVGKIEQKKKDITLKVKINNLDLDMQIDTGREVTLIPINFWERTGKSTLQKSSLLLRQFDESVIKILGYFEGSMELEDKLEVIPIVTTCKKNHGLLGKDVLNVNSTKLM